MTQAISRYDVACRALAEAKTLAEVKDVSDRAAAIQEYARRAKNKILEVDATELRIRAERKLGEILAPMPKATGTAGTGRPKLGSSKKEPPKNTTPTLSDLGIDKKLSSRSQKLANQPVENFEANVCKWRANAEKKNEKVSVAKLLRGDWYQTSETPEWETPQWLFDLLNEEFSFQTDVCASKNNHKCKQYYSRENDGLSKKWIGSCWMNPPYGREIKDWMKKAKAESLNGTTIVCLVPARPDTEWWWDNCIQGEIRFIRGRLKWPGSDTAAPFPSAVVILGGQKSKVVWWDIQK
jgi:phage N-6-adenine-methyltransferase